MSGDRKRGDYGVPARARWEREFREEELCGLLKICHCFFDGFALRGGSGLGIQRDETAFFGGRKDGSEFHWTLREMTGLLHSRARPATVT